MNSNIGDKAAFGRMRKVFEDRLDARNTKIRQQQERKQRFSGEANFNTNAPQADKNILIEGEVGDKSSDFNRSFLNTSLDNKAGLPPKSKIKKTPSILSNPSSISAGPAGQKHMKLTGPYQT